MTARRHPFFTSARGRLLSFNLLMGVVTLLVSGVAVFGFHHASQLQEQVQRQTLNDMRGSMDLARDTANVATAAVRLSQVVGALEYKSEAERLLATQQALKHSLAQLAAAPLAQQEQARVANIIRRSNALQQSVSATAGDTPLRQNRRTPVIEAALAPARKSFAPKDYDMLVKTLALIVCSTESMIVFKDVLRVDEAEARRVKRWATRALVEAARK